MPKNNDLVHGTRRVRIETVKKAHKRACSGCNCTPEDRRLLVIDGSGRAQKQSVYCVSCGAAWLFARVAEYERAVTRLRTGEGAVRI